jgi:hypothetical protein
MENKVKINKPRTDQKSAWQVGKTDGVEDRSCKNELILVIMKDAGAETQSKQIAIGTTWAIFCMYIWKYQGEDKETSVGRQGLVRFLCP